MLIFENDGSVRLTCDEEETDISWEKIAQAAVMTGYDIRSAEDAMDVYCGLAYGSKDKSYRFNNDIAHVIRIIYGYDAPDKAEYVQEAADAAERCVGITNNESLAGYLDTNGNYLYFSGDGITRDRDHREINEVLEELGIEYGNGYSDGMIRFMDMGNIRLGSCGADISVMPNEKQWPKFLKYLRNAGREVYVDLSAKNSGAHIATLKLRASDGNFIRKCIEMFFRKGKFPVNAEVI